MPDLVRVIGREAIRGDEPSMPPSSVNPAGHAGAGGVHAMLARNGQGRAWGSGIGLPARLLGLILLCLLPVIAAETYTNIGLRTQRQAEMGDLALRQAELANRDIGSLLVGTDHLLRIAALLPGVRDLRPSCGSELSALQPQFPEYAFFAVLDGGGRLVCASRPLPDTDSGRPVPWYLQVDRSGDGVAGRYAEIAEIGAILPIRRALTDPSARPGSNQPSASIVAALDLGWFGRHLSALWEGRPALPADTSVVIADVGGKILSRYPDATHWVGRTLTDPVMQFLKANAPGTAFLDRAEGDRHLVAYEPLSVAPLGVAALVIAKGVDVSPGLAGAGAREIVLVASASMLAIALTVIAGRRFFVRPIDRLLQAAQRWRDGDLGARAEVDDPGSEFGRLAASFNEMASALQVRDAELRFQADMLEAQVEARTRDLSETNNRLQVEMAEREKTEAALVQAQKLQAVGQLAGGIAHDFNNMLATILGSLELMERRLQRLSAEQDAEEVDRLQKLIERATDAVQRGAQLTARLLAFSRQQVLAVRPTDLNRLIGDLVTLAASTLGRRVRIRTDLAADLWPALADPTQVEAAILNLCLNARDAMPEGGQLTIATDHQTFLNAGPDGLASGDYVRITVSDTGCGMTQDVLSRAFEPFFSTKGPSGSGLGLSQVYGVARQSNGTVRIASTPGSGTAVTMLLPRARSAPEPVERPRDKSAMPPLVPKLLVLIVDDDAAVRQVTAEMLRNLGCEVIEATCADDALCQLDTVVGAIGLLLIDYVMPGMNGLDLAREVRRRGVAIPMILETGYAEFSDSDVAGGLLDAILHKPFTIRELQAVLLNLRGATLPQGNVVPLRGVMRG
jgi:signal transduction histidine kinase/CheY-like chemotaxis protein